MKLPWTKSTPTVTVGTRRPGASKMSTTSPRGGGFMARMQGELGQLSDQLRAQGGGESGGGYFAWERSVDSVLFWRLPRLRTEARYAFRQASVLRRAVARWKTGVVGSGPRLKFPKPHEAASLAWEEFSEEVDDAGQHSLNSMLRLAVNALMIDGEFFATWVMTPDGLRLRLIDCWRIDTWQNDLKKGAPKDNYVRMGVEFEPSGRVAAFYVLPESKDPRVSVYLTSTRGNADRIPAEDCLWVRNQEYPQQTRGIPLLSAMISRSDVLEEYSNTELERAALESKQLGFIAKTPDSTGVQADGEDPDGTPTLDAGDGYTLHELEDGQTFSAWDTNHPSGNYAPFTEAIMRELTAASEALSTADITGDYSKINFSAGRIAGLHAKESFGAIQELLALRLLKPMFRAWLKRASVQLSLPARLRPLFKFPVPPPVQPKEAIAALTGEVHLGIKSVSEAIRETGRDPEEVFAEIEADKKRMEKIGLEYPQPKGMFGSDSPKSGDDG